MSWSDWLWGSSKGQKGASSNASQDPVQSLDPSLRGYLERETPRPSSKPVPQEAERSSHLDQLIASDSKVSNTTAPPSKATSDPEKPAVPSESLFPDGRYAHLWKTYQPLRELENANKTPQEKLQDIVDNYKERKAAISRAALENCAFEQMAITECYLRGSWMDAATMCRTQNRALERCYTMQAKFLKALGYLSAQDRSQEEEERIQMHADGLYQRMMDQERQAELAKKEGRVLHNQDLQGTTLDAQESMKSGFTEALKARLKADGLLDRLQGSTRKDGKPLTFEDLKPETQSKVLERLKDKTPEEREVEIQAISGEIAANETFINRVLPVFEDDRKQREKRKEEGKETMGDKIKNALGVEGPRRK